MHKFKDINDREWSVQLDAPTIREIKAATDINLADLDGKMIVRLGEDLILLVDVLWIICREQAERDTITDVQFGRALVGNALQDASNALKAAYIDFVPPNRRPLLTAIDAKVNEIDQAAMQQHLKKINDPQSRAKLLEAHQQMLDRQLEESLKALAGTVKVNERQ